MNADLCLGLAIGGAIGLAIGEIATIALLWVMTNVVDRSLGEPR